MDPTKYVESVVQVKENKEQEKKLFEIYNNVEN